MSPDIINLIIIKDVSKNQNFRNTIVADFEKNFFSGNIDEKRERERERERNFHLLQQFI